MSTSKKEEWFRRSLSECPDSRISDEVGVFLEFSVCGGVPFQTHLV